jgi:DNA-binding NtrC family response regulator
MQRSLDILLVEDDPVLGPLTAESLSVCGHRLTFSSTVQSAFDHLRSPNNFDVIILDLQLGVERAEDLINRLHSARIMFPVVIIFSAQPHSELVRSAKAIQAKGTLQKPCTVEQINAMLDRAVA